jgi:hypothetical protein
VKSGQVLQMSEKPDSEKRPPTEPPIPDAANDGFPKDDDVSTPPPDSDVKAGKHKEKD